MHRFINGAVRRAFGSVGWEIRRLPELYDSIPLGLEPLQDMSRLSRLAGRTESAMIFDVGANVGNFIRYFRETFSKPIIHAFEPGSEVFKQLQANTAGIPGITLNNIGLGSRNEELIFLESDRSPMSSFLEPDKNSWSKTARRIKVSVRTVDDYSSEKGIQRIDILKSDTQGYDLQVIRGAEGMISEGRIQLLYIEINFSELYKGQPSFDGIYRHLYERNFRLVAFYRFSYQNNRAGWTDALFTHVSG